MIMSGAATLLLFMLSCCQVFAYDVIDPPEELNIDVPTLGYIILSWKHRVAPQNKSVKYAVNVMTPEITIESKTSNNYSTRFMLALHGGLTAQVATLIYDSQHNSPLKMSEISKKASVDLPPYPAPLDLLFCSAFYVTYRDRLGNPKQEGAASDSVCCQRRCARSTTIFGAEGTSATDLSCQIPIEASGKSPFSCKWTPGAKAPADTEYNLYYRYNKVIERCLDYATELGGQRRTSCRTVSSGISIHTVINILVHINGTSKSLEIKAMEKIFKSSEIETIPPVQKLTLDEKGLHWMKPVISLPEICFQYQVNIWSKGRNDTVTVGDSSYLTDVLQKPFPRQFFRVRAVGKNPCWFSHNLYSPWTDVLHFGEDDESSDTLGIILSVCLSASCVFTFLLCVRFWGHIFPQIPKPKNDLKEAFQKVQSQALMRCNSWDNEEVISYIEEIVELDKYKTSSDYGHIGDYSSSGLCKPLK